MTLLEGTVLFAAGLIAGACNAVAGGGVLFTFPAMMWAGLPPIAASVSSAVSMAGPRERDPSLWRGASPSSRPAKTLRRRQWAGGAVRQGRGACEGSSIRSVERVTGVTKRAVLNLMIAGKASRGLRKRTFARSRKPFGADVDYAQLVKIYGEAPDSFKGRYSPAECIGCERHRVEGSPDPKHISTTLCRAPEPDDADAHAPLHSPD